MLHAPHQTGAREVVITGMAGVGKSTLATKYFNLAYDHNLYDVYLWITAESGEQLIQYFMRFLKNKGISPISTEPEDIMSALTQYISGKKYLLFIDNILSAEEIKECLPGGKGHVILTSRVHDSDWDQIELPVFRETESLSLLFKLVNRTLSEEETQAANVLVRKLGYLPLAIEQAGKYVKNKKRSFEQYLKEYKEKARELLDYREKKTKTKKERTPEEVQARKAVYTTFEISMQVLDPLSRQLMRYFSYFAAENIPTFLFGELVVANSEIDLAESLENLENFSLLRRSQEDPFSVSVHRLVQKVGRLREKEQGGETRTRDNLQAILTHYLSYEDSLLQVSMNDSIMLHCNHMTKILKRYVVFLNEDEEIVTKFRILLNIFAIVPLSFFKIGLFEENNQQLFVKVNERLQNIADELGGMDTHYVVLWVNERKPKNMSPEIEYAVGVLLYVFSQVESIDWLDRASEQGNVLATTVLAFLSNIPLLECAGFNLYEGNFNSEQTLGLRLLNENHAFSQRISHHSLTYLTKSADQGFVYSQLLIAFNYFTGVGINKDYGEALKWGNKAAIQDLHLAQALLGLMYKVGYGDIEKNDELSFYWYQKAAEQGNVQAQLNLGRMYRQGIGTEKNNSLAFIWYEKAALQGEPQAQLALGYLYLSGEGEQEKDLLKGIYWLSYSAEQGNEIAQNIIGDMYSSGEGVSQDTHKANKWKEAAANRDDISILFLLGLLHEEGEGIIKDTERAAQLFEKAAERGHAFAQARMGIRYKYGVGVGKDSEKAVFWLKESALQENVFSKYLLGLMYYEGDALEQNYALAAYWFLLAAEQGDEGSQYYIAMILLYGQEVDQSLDGSVDWLSISAASSYANSQYMLGFMVQNGFGVTKSEERAQALYEEALINPDSKPDDALYEIGHMYEEGILVDLDTSTAQAYYLQAADDGHEKARVKIAEFQTM